MYPERTPIYAAYKAIIEKIIDEAHFKSFAESAIDEIDQSIIGTLKEIRQITLLNADWPGEK